MQLNQSVGGFAQEAERLKKMSFFDNKDKSYLNFLQGLLLLFDQVAREHLTTLQLNIQEVFRNKIR